jgi:tetratricopeptide (TPR) repeat protein
MLAFVTRRKIRAGVFIVASAAALLFIPPAITARAADAAYPLRAEALARQKDFEGLLKHCRKWAQAEPENWLSWQCAASAYHALDNLPFAALAYDEALRLKPENTLLWRNLAQVRDKLGERKAAIIAYRETLAREPGDSASWRALGMALAAENEAGDAAAALERTLKLNPQAGDETLWRTLADAREKSGDIEGAYRAFFYLARAFPEEVELWRKSGKLLRRQGDDEKAAEIYERALLLHPHDAPMWAELGEIRLTERRDAEALEAFERVLAANGNFAEGRPWIAIGGIHARARRPEAALSAYQTATRIAPDNPAAWEKLSVQLRAMDRREEAVAAQRKYLQLKVSGKKQ